MIHSLYVYITSINGYVGCFHLLAIRINAAINADVRTSSLRYVPRAEPLGHMVILFLMFLRNHHIAFHWGCIILHPHRQCTMCPNRHILSNTCYFLGFDIVATLVGVWCPFSFSNASLHCRYFLQWIYCAFRIKEKNCKTLKSSEKNLRGKTGLHRNLRIYFLRLRPTSDFSCAFS